MKTLYAVLASACLAAGCAGTGGTSSAGAAPASRTAGQVIDDATITAQIKAALIADPDLKALAINVDTTNGAVRLKGDIKNIALRNKAASIATNVKGVKSVDNQLVITG